MTMAAPRFWVVRRTSSLLVMYTIPFPSCIWHNFVIKLLTLIATLTGAERFSSVALESLLEEHPDILEAGVIAVTDEELGERPKAYVTAKSGAQINSEELIEWVKCKEISKVMVP